MQFNLNQIDFQTNEVSLKMSRKEWAEILQTDVDKENTKISSSTVSRWDNWSFFLSFESQ